jgi:hypothetical protein
MQISKPHQTRYRPPLSPFTAAVLNANDWHDDARSEIQQALLEKLLPEEQAGTANLRD